jgi:hypothetical protein
MNISLHFRDLNVEKVNQSWDSLIARKQEAEAQVTEVRVPAEEEELEIDDDFNSPTKSGRDYTVKQALSQNDKDVTLTAIFNADKRFIDEASQSKYSAEFSFANEEALIWLFDAALGLKLEEEEFFPANAVSGIPLEMWVRLFQGMTPAAMDEVKARCRKRKVDFEAFKQFLLGVKNVVKYCMDNRAEMISFYDTGPSGIMRDRATHIYKRLVPEKAETNLNV